MNVNEEAKSSNEEISFDEINSETISLPENEEISESLKNSIEDDSSAEILTHDSISSDDKETLDEQSVLNKDTSLEDLDEKLIENNKIKNEFMENNEPSVDSNEEVKTSVRRLSLFDTLDNQEKKEVSENTDKMEPIMEENISDSLENSEKNHDLNEKKEFSPEESIIEEEFNQDPEDEELLDIPTFLRRQAN